MDSTQEGSSICRSKGKTVDKGRRIWTPKEEEILILALKEIVAQGWKADNGFKAGFLKKLEGFLKKQLPETDIRGLPHINSKITTWKKSYYSLCAILSQSGIGFNVDTKTVDCEASHKAEILQSNPNAAKIIGKSWPLYDDWKEIFGNDRANGEGAEDLLEAVNDMDREFTTNNQDFNTDDYHVNLDDILLQDLGENSTCQSTQPDGASNSKGKKRKSSDGFDKVCDVLCKISSNTNSRLEKLVSHIGYDFDLAKARSEVFEKLGNIQGLSSVEKFKVCEILGKEVEKLEIFRCLPESTQLEYVCYVLHSS